MQKMLQIATAGRRHRIQARNVDAMSSEGHKKACVESAGEESGKYSGAGMEMERGGVGGGGRALDKRDLLVRAGNKELRV
jgi:hypothetical protein